MRHEYRQRRYALTMDPAFPFSSKAQSRPSGQFPSSCPEHYAGLHTRVLPPHLDCVYSETEEEIPCPGQPERGTAGRGR
jgi:hypothetical protein